MEKLLLFDIDGTLIDTEGAGLVALEEGLFTAFPPLRGSAFPPLDLGGATDGSVVAFLFRTFEIDDHEVNRKRFFDAYHAALEDTLKTFQRDGRGRVLDGVRPLLDQLSGRRDRWTLGLLTGNTASGARVKLGHYEVGHHFVFGAFGDDHADRNALGPVALERAASEHGMTFLPGDTVVIGDTPKDIACARAFGARVIAVATGASPAADLAEQVPDLLLDSFEDLEKTLAAINEVFR